MSAEVFTAVYNPNFRPFAWREGEQARGVVVDMIATVMERIDMPCTFRPVSLPRLTETVTSGEADAVAGLGNVKARDQRFEFSDPLIETGAAWFAREPVSLDGTSGTRLTRVTTPAGGPLMAEIRRAFPDLQVIRAIDYNSALQLVAEGEADAAALNYHAGHVIAEREFAGEFIRLEPMFLNVSLCLACAAGKYTDLLGEFDKTLGALRAQGKLPQANNFPEDRNAL